MSRNFIEITCDIIHVTDNAVLVNDGSKEVWIPKSQIEAECGEGLKKGDTAVEVMMTEWIAGVKGLI